MTFTIIRTSHKEIDYPGARLKKPSDQWCYDYILEINSLEDLKKLEEYYDEKLIISMRHMTIEIYDTYRE